MVKLNSLLDYTLVGKEYQPTQLELSKQQQYPVAHKDDWYKSHFDGFKQNLKKEYSRRQKRKCAYCRSTIKVDGKGEPTEHIVARDNNMYWTFVPKNLVVSCLLCNSSKGTIQVTRYPEINYGFSPENYPNSPQEFRLFNPHFDRWSDHFEVEDDFFLVPKSNTKGPFTYHHCNLKRYQIIIDYRDQLRLRDNKTYRSLLCRIRTERDPDKLEELQEGLNYVKDLIEND